MRYFAYGSNLNTDDLARWSLERGLPPIALAPVGPAYLPDRRLSFTHRSTTRGGGVLDVVPAVGSAVAGVVFDLAPRDLASIDRKEGEGHLYRRLETVALTEDGGETAVTTYEVDPSRREAFVPPAAGYLEVVRRGYDAFALDPAPLEAAARGEVARGAAAHLFVYGTLRHGEVRHPALLRHRAGLRAVGRVPGILVDLGAYPGLLAPSAPGTVAGEVYTAPDFEALLIELDAVESFRGFGAAGSLYRRAIVRARLDGGDSVAAWTYVYAADVTGAPVIAGGDWRRR